MDDLDLSVVDTAVSDDVVPSLSPKSILKPIHTALVVNGASVLKCHDIHKANIDHFAQVLTDPNVSEEFKDKTMDRMENQAAASAHVQRDHQKFVWGTAVLSVAATVFIFVPGVKEAVIPHISSYLSKITKNIKK